MAKHTFRVRECAYSGKLWELLNEIGVSREDERKEGIVLYEFLPPEQVPSSLSPIVYVIANSESAAEAIASKHRYRSVREVVLIDVTGRKRENTLRILQEALLM